MTKFASAFASACSNRRWARCSEARLRPTCLTRSLPLSRDKRPFQFSERNLSWASRGEVVVFGFLAEWRHACCAQSVSRSFNKPAARGRPARSPRNRQWTAVVNNGCRRRPTCETTYLTKPPRLARRPAHPVRRPLQAVPRSPRFPSHQTGAAWEQRRPDTSLFSGGPNPFGS